MRLPAVLFEANASEDGEVVPASLLECCTSVMPFEFGTVTAKGAPLLATPPTVTTTLPLVAPAGTGATMLAGLQLVGVVEVPLNVTGSGDDPKFSPAIVTGVPTGPLLGVRLVMVGPEEATVNAMPLLATPPTVTMILPLVEPAGTGATILVGLQLVGVVEVLLNVTVPGDDPKFVPEIVTSVPTGPLLGVRLVMAGPLVPPIPALNAASNTPPLLEADIVPLTDIGPAADWIASSAISFVPGATGTASSSVYPAPAVNVTLLELVSSPRIRSPLAVVVAEPLFNMVPEACPAAVTSREFEVAAPEYSRIAKRKVLFAIDFVTVTVLAPPAMFSA